MAELVELTPQEHGDLKLDTLAAIKVAKDTHILTLRVTEISRAACQLPVFLTSSGNDDAWLLSAITSLEVDRNMMVEDDKWNGIFQPISMMTYPFFLMKHPSKEGQYTVGVDPENKAFSTEEGEPIFEENKKAGQRLSQVTQALQQDLNNGAHTFQFCKHVSDLGLITPVDVVVGYEGGRINKLKGLNTIDETKLAALSEEQFAELRKKNYLAPIYSLLISLYQLNTLIKVHNQRGEGDKILQVSMNPEKDEAAEAQS